MKQFTLTILFWRQPEIISAESPRNARRKFRKLYPSATIVSCEELQPA